MEGVDELILSGLGNAINNAVTVAGLLVDEGLAEMVSCNTDFPAMPSATAKKTEDGKSFERGVPLVKNKNFTVNLFKGPGPRAHY